MYTIDNKIRALYIIFGESMLASALYYPYLSFSNIDFVKSLALFYGKIYRIVPPDVNVKLDDSLKPLFESGAINGEIDPSRYAYDASQLFIKKCKTWFASALGACKSECEEMSLLHKEKIDYKVRQLFTKLGYKETESWISVPSGLASNYMLYLALEISKRNNLNLITDEWAPWAGTSFFEIDGKYGEYIAPYGDGPHHPFALFCLIIGQLVPINIHSISAKKIVKFREHRHAEIENFYNEMCALHSLLQTVEDPIVQHDTIIEKVKSLNRAQIEYKKSADLLKVKGWCGFAFAGFPAIAKLGAMFEIPYASTIALASTSLAIGGVIQIYNTKQELKKLRKENPVSLLFDMQRHFKGYPSWRDYGDVNNHAFNCLEEYVND